MKYYLSLSLSAILFLTSCAMVPTLNPEYDELALQVGRYICLAEEAGVIKGVEDLSVERIKSIVARYEGTGVGGSLLTPDQLQARLNEVSQDPIQFGLFLTTMISQQKNCLADNTNAAG